jgi:NTP pyrophosphatase (non-canonical NTP hydrolase)
MVAGIEATYMDFCKHSGRYPIHREKEYLMIGLMNEAGEVGGAFKKEIRDEVDNKELIIEEMGDVLWYLTNLCRVYGITISQLMNGNINKLLSRMTPEQAKDYRKSMGLE